MEDPAFSTLETHRLSIRRFRANDARPLAAYRNDPAIARYQGWERPYSLREASDFIESLHGLAPGTPNSWFQFAIGLAKSGFLIGDAALRTTSEDPTHAELGFSFATAHPGCGYASEAVRAVIEYAFDDLEMQRIFAITDSRNFASQKLLNRLDFQLEEKIDRSAWLYGRFAPSSSVGQPT